VTVPRPLVSAAPSTLALLHECGYRVALRRYGGGARRSTPWARLGTASHAVLAAAISNDLGTGGEDFDARFQKAWDEAICAAAAAADADPVERLWGEPLRWPTYADRKLRTRRLALQIAKDRATWPDPEVVVERRLRSADGRIYGTPDVVVRHPLPHRIEDFKTGGVFDEENLLKERYRRQILIYAYLEQEESGSMPDQGVVRPLRGPAVVFSISTDDVQGELLAALAAMDAFNAAVDHPEQLARPSTTNCRTCPHTSRCEPFWAMIRDAPPAELIGIGGTVLAVHSTESNGIALHIAPDEGNIDAGEVAVRGIPSPFAPWLSSSDAGQHVRVVGLGAIGGTAASFAARGMLRIDEVG
jgi:hypothetical protein